jgi:hypothetical protein
MPSRSFTLSYCFYWMIMRFARRVRGREGWRSCPRRQNLPGIHASLTITAHGFRADRPARHSVRQRASGFRTGVVRFDHHKSVRGGDANSWTERHNAGNAGPVRAADRWKRIFPAGPGRDHGKPGYHRTEGNSEHQCAAGLAGRRGRPGGTAQALGTAGAGARWTCSTISRSGCFPATSTRQP